MTHDDFVLLINVLFAGLLALSAILGFRCGSAWQ